MARTLFKGRLWGLGNFGAVGLLVPAALVAAGGGFALQRTIIADDDGPAELALTTDRLSAPVYDCPDDPTVADVHNGDRVFAIGVHDELAGWLLIRNPIDPERQWWIEERYVTTDEPITGLPELGCDDPVPRPSSDGGKVDDDPEPSTTSTSPGAERDSQDDDPATTTTETGQTDPEGGSPTQPGPGTPTPTTVSPSPDPGPTPTTSPPTPTTAPDSTPPSLSVSRSAADVWESSPGLCLNRAKQSTISATFSDPSGIRSARATWSVGNHNESKDISSGSVSFGPYSYPTVPEGSPVPVSVTVTVTDNEGNTASRTVTITLHSSAECFG